VLAAKREFTQVSENGVSCLKKEMLSSIVMHEVVELWVLGERGKQPDEEIEPELMEHG
jgi:hypothetical protein